MDLSREAGVGAAPVERVTGAERAAGAAGLGLLTLPSAQFLMTLDGSVVNMSIATVAKNAARR